MKSSSNKSLSFLIKLSLIFTQRALDYIYEYILSGNDKLGSRRSNQLRPKAHYNQQRTIKNLSVLVSYTTRQLQSPILINSYLFLRFNCQKNIA